MAGSLWGHPVHWGLSSALPPPFQRQEHTQCDTCRCPQTTQCPGGRITTALKAHDQPQQALPLKPMTVTIPDPRGLLLSLSLSSILHRLLLVARDACPPLPLACVNIICCSDVGWDGFLSLRKRTNILYFYKWSFVFLVLLAGHILQ